MPESDAMENLKGGPGQKRPLVDPTSEKQQYKKQASMDKYLLPYQPKQTLDAQQHEESTTSTSKTFCLNENTRQIQSIICQNLPSSSGPTKITKNKIPPEFFSGPIIQPRRITFPQRQFGKQKRSFQSAWFDKFTWLHYCEGTDSVLCYLCMNAPLLGSTKREEPFVSEGSSNWKKALSKFEDHETSSCHKIATQEKLLEKQCGDVGESLSLAHKEGKQSNRKILLEILRCIRFLAKQGLPLRGDGEDSGNLIEIIKMKGETNEDIMKWLKRPTNKYTSKDVQNEMLQIMAMFLLRNISENIRNTHWFTIMGDEVTDSSNKEQFVICIRWVNDQLEDEGSFVGLYNVDNTRPDTLTAAMKDVLLRLNLPLTSKRGQCYDGAANMTGTKSGVSTQINQVAPKAVFTHCYGHSLQLAVSDTMRQVKSLRDAFDVVQEISKLIKFSPKRNTMFDKIKAEMAPDTPGFRSLCPTRWTVRANSLQSVIDNYKVLLLTWDECLDETNLDSEIKARVIGVKAQMETFEFFYGMKLACLILKMTDNLSRTLQHSHMSASEGQAIARGTVKTLESMRSGNGSKLFWDSLCQEAENLSLPKPCLPRSRRTPVRFEIGRAPAEFATAPEEYFNRDWNESFDHAIVGIKDRFNQAGYDVLSSIEVLLANAVNNKSFDDELSCIEETYTDDFDSELLRTQLTYVRMQLVESCGNTREVFSWRNILELVQKMTPSQRVIVSEVHKFIKLLLLIPATNAVSERSASALRRIKTYLRSTMKQQRLNNCMLLHVHKEATASIDLTDIANEFVNNENRE